MTSMEVHERLLSIERQLWTNDAAVYAANLLDNAVLVFAETGVITRDAALDAIRRENVEGRRWAEVRIEEVQSSLLTNDTALLMYRVTARWEHESSAIVAYASSLYMRQQAGWKLAFHQQTPIQT